MVVVGVVKSSDLSRDGRKAGRFSLRGVTLYTGLRLLLTSCPFTVPRSISCSAFPAYLPRHNMLKLPWHLPNMFYLHHLPAYS
jgi:hypothetical protein